MGSDAAAADYNDKGVAQFGKPRICEEDSVPSKLFEDKVCSVC